MAATQDPIIWDFYRALPSTAINLGSTVEYANTKAQSIYINDGLRTIMTIVNNGHWKDTIMSEEEMISNSNYDFSSWDHPENGYLMGVAQNSNDLYFIRYRYKVPGYD